MKKNNINNDNINKDNINLNKINNVDYSTYVGMVEETNRPSGGIKTVQRVCVNAFINSSHRVLEIGSNTGFTSRNITQLTNAEVIGIDLVDESLRVAANKAKELGLKKIKFVKASATAIPYPDGYFDVVWVSNVLSFIEKKDIALKECLRVLKNNGYLIFVPIYYRESPPKSIINEVNTAIGAKIDIFTKASWLKFIKSMPISTELIFEEDYKYLDVEKDIKTYIDEVFNKPRLNDLDSNTNKILKNKGIYFMKLFNKNLQFAGYSIFILQKRRYLEEKELFITQNVNA